MRPSRRLREDLRFVTEFSELFDVRQQVALTQLRRAQAHWAHSPRLTRVLEEEYLPLLPLACRTRPLVRGGAAGRVIVLITSDEGFVGPLHAAVVRDALALAEGTTCWVLVGRRGLRLLGSRAARAEVVPMPPEHLADAQMQRIAQVVVARYTEEALREAWLVAPRFISTARQEVGALRLLPLPVGGASAAPAAGELVLEPSLDRVLERLARAWTEAACVDAFRSARCAELAARALHIEVSRRELAKRSRMLRHELFKTLHERLDVMVRETCVVQRHLARRPRHPADCARETG